jgi:hypothetical protein
MWRQLVAFWASAFGACSTLEARTAAVVIRWRAGQSCMVASALDTVERSVSAVLSGGDKEWHGKTIR